MSILGIDPGLDGALALLDESGQVVSLHRMPVIAHKKAGGKGVKRELNLPAIRELLRELRPDVVALEAATCRPGQTAQTMMGVGYGFGAWRMLMTCQDQRHQIVYPQVWQRVMFRGMPKGDTKERARRAAQQRWPAVDWRGPGATARCLAAHDGCCDAALIAAYVLETGRADAEPAARARPAPVLLEVPEEVCRGNV